MLRRPCSSRREGVRRRSGRAPPASSASGQSRTERGVEIGQVAIVSIVIPVLIALDRLMAVDSSKPARAATLVYALSALIAVLGSYWFLTRVLDA